MRGYQIPVLESRVRDDFTVSVPQAGKTTTGVVWLATATWYAGALPWAWWWVAPTYDLTKAGFLAYVEAMASAGVLESHTETPPLKARLTNGARVEGRSWHKAENLRGHPIAGAVVDEFGLLTNPAYKNLTARRLETIVHGLGFYRYLGNVGEIGGKAEELWNMAGANARDMVRRRWTWRDRARELACSCRPEGIEPELGTGKDHADDCPRSIYVRFVENEADRLARREFDQVFEAEWSDVNDLPVFDFIRDRHVDAEKAAWRPGLPLDLSVDFNVDPMAWTIGQHHREEAWAVDEILIPGGARTEQACRELTERYPNRDLEVHVYGDATGRRRDTRSKASDYDLIEKILGRFYRRVALFVPEANPSVTGSVNAFNARLLSRSGLVRYWIHPRVENLIRDLAKVEWIQGTREINKRKDKTLTHSSDGERYRMDWLFPIEGGAQASKVGSPEEEASYRRAHQIRETILDMDF